MMHCVQLPDNFQMREHSWPCRFHITNYNPVKYIYIYRNENRRCVKAVSRRFVSYELLPFVIVNVMTLHPWKRTLHSNRNYSVILATLQITSYALGV